MTIGDRIKSLRIAKGLSQDELGQMIGVKKAAIYKYETGLVVNLKRSTISALANALDTSPANLMVWDDEESVEDAMKEALSRLGAISQDGSVDFDRVEKLAAILKAVNDVSREGPQGENDSAVGPTVE